MPPPGLAPASSRRNHLQRETDTVEGALRAAYDYFSTAGFVIGHRKTARIVRTYLATRATDQTFGEWVIAYRDPTGETAVRNVMRGGHR